MVSKKIRTSGNFVSCRIIAVEKFRASKNQFRNFKYPLKKKSESQKIALRNLESRKIALKFF